MTDKLHCPFCSEELTIQPRKVANFEIAVCSNPVCEYAGWHLPVDIFVRLIDGKKAQDALKVAIDIAHKLYDEIRYNNCIENTPISDEVMRFANEQIQKITSITKGEDNDLA